MQTKRALILYAIGIFIIGVLTGGIMERHLANRQYAKALSLPITETLVVLGQHPAKNVMIDGKGNAYIIKPVDGVLHSVYTINKEQPCK